MTFRAWVLIAVFACSSAFAEEAAPPKQLAIDPSQFPAPVELVLPDKYMTSNGLAPSVSAKEGAKTVNGKLYTVVAPLFDGSDGNYSYLRLGNGNNFSVAFSVLIVGNQTGKLYGTALYTVQPYASPQMFYGDIIKKIGVTGPTGSDTGFAFYLYTGLGGTAYQHVIYNLNNKFFENASLCTLHDGLIYTPLNQLVVDVHTSIVAAAGYPSILFIHNYANTTVSYIGYIIESETGEQKGSVSLTLGPNQSYVLPWSTVEQTIHWTPTSAEAHANIGWARADGLAFTGLVGSSVYNQNLQAYVNMSLLCPINRD